ncbi:acyltransferase ChoActase/COT/CPT [Blastocladiella britannica]|nr:acyltransferase ChoActase/COT/CPT [Blastocladiella britannica]
MTKAAEPTPTFANQAALPRLPIPPVDATLKKYRYTLTALLTEDELKATDAAIAASASQLADLQKRLHAHDATQPNSWLEDWWYRLAYCSWRVPLMINSNWWLFIKDDHIPYLKDKIVRSGRGTFTSHQIKRAAGLASNLLTYKELVDNQQIPAEATRAGPLCMDQYRHMFGVTRNPLPGADEIRRGFPYPSTHMVVLVRDQCYQVSLVDAAGHRLRLSDLESSLNAVVADVQRPDYVADYPVPLLTSEHRDTWAAARAKLLAVNKRVNGASLEAIETALFTLSLDDWSPGPDMDEGHRTIAHGFDGHNRWYDKALNVIVTASGRGGCNGEHSPQDALTPAVMFEHILRNEPARDPTSAPAASVTGVKLVPVQRLRFDVPSAGDDGATMRKYVADADLHARTAINDSDIGVLITREYGLEFIKKRAKVSPDAYLQMTMQLAFKKLHGYQVPTYETAATRSFKHGRTETSRTLLPEVKAFIEAQANPKTPATARLALFKTACAAQGKYIAEASRGMGVDRHLLGLRLCLKPGETPPPIFTDPAYAQSCAWRLSTSGLGARSYTCLYGTGFGCVEPNGYGINYFGGPDVIHFGIESKRSCAETSTDRFRISLLAALREMRELVEHAEAEAGAVPTPKGKL